VPISEYATAVPTQLCFRYSTVSLGPIVLKRTGDVLHRVVVDGQAVRLGSKGADGKRVEEGRKGNGKGALKRGLCRGDSTSLCCRNRLQ
jgi:hypothetical protein